MAEANERIGTFWASETRVYAVIDSYPVAHVRNVAR